MSHQSPYEQVLGVQTRALDPELRTYFSVIPEGHVGRGVGTFAEFGCPRPWVRRLLRPVLRRFEQRGVLFAGYERDVPFLIENRSTQLGDTTRTNATRVIHTQAGTWTMRDSVFARGSRLVDQLGATPTVAASFEVGVRDGALTLESVAVSLRVGRFRMRLPRLLSPVVRLTERFDRQRARHHVHVTIDAPLIGRIYLYRGHFDYAIYPEGTAGER